MSGVKNCKTYVEGKGWIYNFELNREVKEKTVDDLIQDIFQTELREMARMTVEESRQERIKVGAIKEEEVEDWRMRAKYN